MSNNRRWDRCIHQRNEEVKRFVIEYLRAPNRYTVLIAGAGLDPRAAMVCELLARGIGPQMYGFFVREERPNPSFKLIQRAEQNLKRMVCLIPKHDVKSVEVFARDGAVVGGRKIVGIVHELDLNGATDVVVDLSALSMGISFPLVRHLLERAQRGHPSFNLHLMVTDEPTTDDEIVAIGCDAAGTVHGFKGRWGLDESIDAAKLWLPQLVGGQRMVLERIRAFVDPHDVCPILPFPARSPRLADELIAYYAQEFENLWQVDARNIVYAAENNPLDLYRTILGIDDARKRVFAETGGSLIVLSPIGSKVLAVGALMAAIERDFPVVYVESIEYAVDFETIEQNRHEGGEMVHVWLYGEAYGKPSRNEIASS